MKKFICDFSVPAGTEAEAETKLNALKIIASKLTANELINIAEVVSNPIKLLFAKQKLGL
jgi:hypothetical protein